MESTHQPSFVEIYTEATPNPNTLKFVTNRTLLPNMIIECKSSREAQFSPLAEALLAFPFVSSVFISNQFITITKDSEKDWFELSLEIKAFLKEYLLAGKEVVLSAYIHAQKAIQSESANAPEIEVKIKTLLDKYVAPAVEMDGGHIAFQSFENGIVTLSMQGSCSGCPSSTATLKDGIEAMLKRMIPEVKEVVAEAG